MTFVPFPLQTQSFFSHTFEKDDLSCNTHTPRYRRSDTLTCNLGKILHPIYDTNLLHSHFNDASAACTFGIIPPVITPFSIKLTISNSSVFFTNFPSCNTPSTSVIKMSSFADNAPQSQLQRYPHLCYKSHYHLCRPEQ